MDDAVEVLMQAGALLHHDGWCRGWGDKSGARCVLHALYDATNEDDPRGSGSAYLTARAAICEVTLGEDAFGDLGNWNDFPGRTIGEVQAALARAILLLRQGEVTPS